MRNTFHCASYERNGPNHRTMIGPYDAIHVGAVAPVVPKPLVEQLAKPGRMFIPVGTDSQVILQVDKDENGNITETELFGVMVSKLRRIPSMH